MSEEEVKEIEVNEKSVPESKNMIMSFLGLAAALVGIFYLYPMVQKSYDKGKQSEVSVVSNVEAELPVNQVATQCSDELLPYLKLIKEQMPKSKSKSEDGQELDYQIIHLRMSENKGKLLLDLKEVEGDHSSRKDLILIRDEFGRYVSKNTLFNIRIYPPEK